VAAAYSLDLRRRVIATIDDGTSRREAAELFNLGVSTVIRWARRAAETGSCAAAPSGGDHKSQDIEVHREWLLNLVSTEADLTLEEIRIRLRETHGLRKSPSCLWRFFARHKVTFKKRARIAAPPVA
jgi:transposase